MSRGRPDDRRRRRGLLSFSSKLIPQGEPMDLLLGWLDQGLDVEIYLRHAREGGVWMIRVGNRELSVEEYLLLFDEGHT